MSRLQISLMVVVLLGIIPLAPAKAFALSLADCYTLALQKSESVAISAEAIAQARARYGEAMDQALPKLSATASEQILDQSGVDGGSSSSFTRGSQPKVALSLEQPLFQGFQEFAALKMAKWDREVAHYKKEEAKWLLFRDVAEAYYNVAKLDREIDTSQQMIAILQKSITDIKNRVALGKSREGELAAEETTLALTLASLQSAKGERAVNGEALAFLTGVQPETPIALTTQSIPKPAPLESYLSSLDQRPDLQIAVGEKNMAQAQVKFEKGTLLPEAGMTFNYYAYRTGVLKEVDWDTLFSLSLPIFNWGNVSRVREAKSKSAQAQLATEEKRRLIETEIRKTHAALQSARAEFSLYREAVTKAQKNYRLQVADLNLGLALSLDVFQAEENLFDAMKRRDHALLKAWYNQVALDIAAGRLPGVAP